VRFGQIFDNRLSSPPVSTQTPTQPVRSEQVGQVLVIHLDDGKANALTTEIMASINSALDRAESDQGIRAVVLHGRTGRFSGGFDLSIMRGGDFAAIVNLVSDGGDLVRRFFGCSVPVIMYRPCCRGWRIDAARM